MKTIIKTAGKEGPTLKPAHLHPPIPSNNHKFLFQRDCIGGKGEEQ